MRSLKLFPFYFNATKGLTEICHNVDCIRFAECCCCCWRDEMCVFRFFSIISNSTQIIHLSETPYSKSLYITIQLRQCAIVLQCEVWASVRMKELMAIQVISRNWLNLLARANRAIRRIWTMNCALMLARLQVAKDFRWSTNSQTSTLTPTHAIPQILCAQNEWHEHFIVQFHFIINSEPCRRAASL